MEGSVSEEDLKSVKRGADASQGSTECRRVKRKRVKKKRASGLQRGTDASEEGNMAGGSDCHQVKRKRVKQESFSWLPRAIDADRERATKQMVANPRLDGLEKDVDL